MPILAIIYAGFLCWNIFGNTRDQVKRHEPPWYVVFDLMLSLVIPAAFVAYWVHPVVDTAPRIAPYLWASSWVWAFCWAPHEMRMGFAKLSSELERRLFRRFFWLEPVMQVPALWFGGKAVLRVL
jgi:hypothetical protein